jgi:translation initiation factor IF-1
MIRIACDDDVASLSRGTFREMLHASNKRTRCVDHFRRTVFELALYLRRHSMRTNNGDRVGVSFVRRINGRNTLRAEPFHLLGIVNQWTQRADGPRAFFNHFFHHLDCAFDAETEPVFVCE